MALLAGSGDRDAAANRRALNVWLPAALALAFACASYWPSRTEMIGVWQDVPFNVWHFLFLWRRLDALGPLALFSRALWNAPIYWPGELHLALSENQLWPAILLWPVWRISGSAIFALDLGALLSSLAACASAAAWLGGRGVREMRVWGGLYFSACGWLQCQYLHWQSCCIFVLPLALWSWDRFRARPTIPRTLSCAFLFGWIAGWNIYFAAIALACLGLALAHAWLRELVAPARLALLGALAALVTSPILARYLQLERVFGSFAFSGAQGANAWSWLARSGRPSLLESLFAFWPRADPLSVEGVGFVGMAFAALALVAALRIPRVRWTLGFSLIAYLISLGPGHILYGCISWLPVLDGLRAIGRVQLAVLLFALPAVFALLESGQHWRRWLPLSLLFLELMPANAPLRSPFPESDQAREGPLSPVAALLAGAREPVLVLPAVSPWLQLAASRADVPLIGGYSGRTPLPDVLLDELATVRRWPLAALLDYTRARRVLTVSERTDEARASPRLRPLGCAPLDETQACLFETTAPPPDEPLLQIDRELELGILASGKSKLLVATAKRAGRLDHDSLVGCRLLRVARWKHLPALESELPLIGAHFSRLRFAAGDEVFARPLPDPFSAWPRALRPELSAKVVCVRD